MSRILAAFFAVTLITFGAPARADDTTQLSLIVKDHVFTPSELHAPANKPIIITFENQDTTMEEFDSESLKAEKVVLGGRSVKIRLPAMPAGRYPFIGEFHAETAKGVLIVE